MKSLGLELCDSHSVRLWTCRATPRVCLVIEAEDEHYEIVMGPGHVGSLRDHLPDVLTGLNRWAADDAACAKAEHARQRAVDAAAQALDEAVAADRVGAYELARSLRAAVAEMTAKADTVDAALRALDDAASEADLAAESLMNAMLAAKKNMAKLQDQSRPELVET